MAQVELVPMTTEEYEAWLPRSIAEYAEDNIVSARWSREEALLLSRTDFAQLLPEGLATPKAHIWTITRQSDSQGVGVLWIQEQESQKPLAFVYNLEIFERFRRHGYAFQAMTLLEAEARRLGLGSIRLHVFGHNAAARPLYEKLGYVPTNLMMAKVLPE